MAFFDFLSAPAQDHEFVAKKKRPLTPDEEAILNEAPPPGFVPPQEQDRGYASTVAPQEPESSQLSPADRRRLYASQESALVKREQRAIAQVRDILDQTNSLQTPELARVKRELGKGAMSSKQVLSDLDEILKKKGWSSAGNVVIDPGHLQRLGALRNELGAVVQEREQFDAAPRPEMPKQVDPDALERDAKGLLQKIETSKAELANLGVLAGEKKRKEAEAYQAQANALMKLAGEERSRLEAQGSKQPPTFAEKNADPNLPPTSRAPISDEFNALGVKRAQLAESTQGALEAAGIEEGEWDSQVPTQAGLKRILSVLDKDGTFAQKLAADIVAEKRRNQAQQGDEFDAEQKKIEGRADRLSSQLAEQRSELKELYKSLNSQPFMQTWFGLTLYVLLGMLAGPTNAARLLGVGRNRNAIMGEIESLKAEMRDTNRQMEREEDRGFQLRKEAISRLNRDRDYQRSKDDSIQKMYLNHKLILERAKRSAAPQNKAIISKLEGDFNRTLKFMADAEQIMNNDWLDDRDPKKIKASREYDRLNQEAQFIDQKLRALTEQIAPGTYSEEEEATAP